MYWAAHVITLGLLICLPLSASTDSLTGKVVKITDGDTLYVLVHSEGRASLLRASLSTVGLGRC